MRDDFGLIGLKLDERYKIEAQLGAGGAGVVFDAYDHTLKRHVAVKIVRPEHAWSPDRVDAFIDEARIVAKLDHPHILSVYDLGSEMVQDKALVYVVMQLASGGTLAERLTTGPLSLEEAAQILQQVCQALDYAHSRDVIHLDLKPHNILFDRHGNILVADFGLAKLLETATRVKAETGMGTPDYMAPEQLLGEEAGPFSDVYALGVTLYQLLTGKLPEHKVRKTGSVLQFDRTLPPGIRLVIERATQRAPERRYNTAGALAQALQKAVYPPSTDIIPLRNALRDLGQFDETHADRSGLEVATYAFQQAGLFDALGYKGTKEETLLTRQQADVILHAPDGHLLAVLRFVSPGRSPGEGMALLKQAYAASLLPDVGVLCNGSELWLYHRTETGLYHSPTLHLKLKDATDADAQRIRAWLGRREAPPALPPTTPPPPTDATSPPFWQAPVWRFGVGLIGLLTLVGLFLGLRELGTRQSAAVVPAAVASITPAPPSRTTTPSPPTLTATPSPSPSSTATPSLTPSATATPTASPTPTPYVKIDQEQKIYASAGSDYEILGVVNAGSRLPLLGRVTDGSWWQLDYLGRAGWMTAQPAGASVLPTLLPVVTPAQLPTVAPPTPTPLPTPACATLPGGEFAAAWREPLISARLGCPITPEHVTGSAYARFQHGFMYWREDERLIYVLYDDGDWQLFPDTWEEGVDPVNIGLTPPSPELQEPIRGFGKVWREQLGGPEAAIGWATENEIGGENTIQDFKGGLMFELKGTLYLLYRDNMTWQPYSPGIGIPPTPIAPSSLYLAFVRGFADDADIWIVDSDGSNPTPFVSGRGDQSEPDWSPNGRRLAYQSNQNGNYDVWVIDVDDGSQRALTASSADEREPDWSPDGQQIIYRRGGERNGDGELWVMDANGETQRTLGQAVRGRAPVWSPDGQRVAFMSERGGNWDIYLFDLTSGETTKLTECETHCRFPAWTLDGTHVAYNVSESASNFSPVQIWQVPADGTGTPQLLIEGSNPGRPAWSKEGWVAFNTSDEIDIMRADGSGRHALPNADEGWAPDWSR